MKNLMDDFIEILLPDQDAFLKIKETLTRIGIASKKDQTLYQSCHILHKKGKYYIVHFKQLFELDGKFSDISENDIGRTNTIAQLLEDWGLVTLVNPEKIKNNTVPLSQIKILAYKDKNKWCLKNKHALGTTHNY